MTDRQAALMILADGFRDATGSFGMHDAGSGAPLKLTGVWLSDCPLDPNDGVSGNTVLEVTLGVPIDELARYEWVEQGKGYREWLIPAAFLRERGAVVRLLEGEVDETFVVEALAMRRSWCDAEVRAGRMTDEQAEDSMRRYEELMRRWEPPE